jgi:lipoprotein-anchoring transpeptidase ErfK/SrfK
MRGLAAHGGHFGKGVAMFRSLFRSLIAGAVAAVGLAASVHGAAARDTVSFSPSVEPGTIVISASQRKLFYVIRPGVAIRYPVAVPKRGKEWAGYAEVDGKYLHPDWTPPDAVRVDHPELPSLIPGGSPRNPMGFAALTLDRGEVAIHGTSPRMRASIGSAASYGCIRMLNEDVADLYSRVDVGAPVIMQP